MPRPWYLWNLIANARTGLVACLLADFKRQLQANLAEDGAGQLVYLAPTRVNLQLTEERWPDIRFAATRETTIFAD